jgi:hypothetical protein
VKSKTMASAAFSRIFKMQEFAAGGAVPEDLGSHSIRKFVVPHSGHSGCSKDEINLRGQWKSKCHLADVYEDTELPYPDAKVIKILRIGGSCVYLFPEELDTTNTGRGRCCGGFDNDNGNDEDINSEQGKVMPNIRKRMSDAVALVLGKALMWLIYSAYDMEKHIVPEDFKREIRMEWKEIITLKGGNTSFEKSTRKKL